MAALLGLDICDALRLTRTWTTRFSWLVEPFEIFRLFISF